MKSNSSGPAPPLAPEPGDGVRPDGLPQLIAATSQAEPGQADALARARAFAEPLLIGETLETGENTLAHADAVAAILNALGSSETMQAAAYLVYTCNHLNKPEEVIGKAFGSNFAALAVETTKLMRVQTQAREAQVAGLQVDDAATQNENVRKMLLAFSRDLRVVLLRLASRLQTLRFYAATKLPCPAALAREARVSCTWSSCAPGWNPSCAPTASAPASRAGPSISTASSRRCAASRSTSTRYSTYARCA